MTTRLTQTQVTAILTTVYAGGHQTPEEARDLLPTLDTADWLLSGMMLAIMMHEFHRWVAGMAGYTLRTELQNHVVHLFSHLNFLEHGGRTSEGSGETLHLPAGGDDAMFAAGGPQMEVRDTGEQVLTERLEMRLPHGWEILHRSASKQIFGKL